MPYVDGFVVVVPKKNVKTYVAMAKKCAPIFREYGALEFRECCGEDLKAKMGLSFPKLTKAKAGETVFFSWITYKTRAHRDRVNAKAMKDPRLADMMDPKTLPFDGKRMIFGGFELLVDLAP